MSTVAIMLLCLLLAVVYMTAWFLVSRTLKRLDVADTAWGGGFIVIATTCLIARPGWRSAAIWALVMVWGIRLAIHIWRRNAFKGPDKRYEELSAKWPRQNFWRRAYVSIFITQALLIFVVSLPIMIASGANHRLGLTGGLAIAMWVFGFLFEAVSDRQLAHFLALPQNRGKLLMSGLWKYSRHPNYFGELTQWWALALLALGSSASWAAFVGPALLTYLILFVSGVPPVEKRHAQRPGYEGYKKRTSLIIPLPPKP